MSRDKAKRQTLNTRAGGTRETDPSGETVKAPRGRNNKPTPAAPVPTPTTNPDEE